MDIYFNKKTLHCDKIMEVWYDLLAKIPQPNHQTFLKTYRTQKKRNKRESLPSLILDVILIDNRSLCYHTAVLKSRFQINFVVI